MMKAQTIGKATGEGEGDSLTLDVAGVGSALDIATGIINTLSNIFGGGPSRWEDAGEGVHAWFTAYGPQAFLDWMTANHPDKFGSVDQAMALMPVWFRTRPYGIDYLIRPSDHYSANPSRWWYSNPLTVDAYRAMGIDYFASLAASPNPNVNAKFIGLNGGEVTADGAQLVVDAAAGPRPENMNTSDWTAVQDAAAGYLAEAGTDGPPSGPASNTALLVGSALFALFVLPKLIR